MILLRNFDFANKYYNYQSKIEMNDTSFPRIKGWYKLINGIVSGVIVKENDLYFLYGDKEFLIKDSYQAIINHKTVNEFCLKTEKDIVVKFNYSIPNIDLNISPFEYIDEDDFKWGDFLAKIINDKNRKNNFIENLSE